MSVFVLLGIGCAQNPSGPTPLSGGALGTGAAVSDARIDPNLGHGGMLLETSLTGAAERAGPGDPDGQGTARVTLNRGQNEVCFALQVSNIAPATAAHIHVGGPSVAGPVVVGLTPPTSGSSSGCVGASSDLIDAIAANPAGYYVNVHNPPFPAGAVRGQLSR